MGRKYGRMVVDNYHDHRLSCKGADRERNCCRYDKVQHTYDHMGALFGKVSCTVDVNY